MTVTFTVPNQKLQRLSDALASVGYVFNPALGTTDLQQRRAFLGGLTKDFWQSIVFNYERQAAIALEPNDTAAEQAKRFVDLSDITSNVS